MDDNGEKKCCPEGKQATRVEGEVKCVKKYDESQCYERDGKKFCCPDDAKVVSGKGRQMCQRDSKESRPPR